MKNRLGALTLALSVAPGASAGLPFDQMIVFGASYDDAGQFPDPDFGYATGLRFTKAHVTHPELQATFHLEILGVKKNPQVNMPTRLYDDSAVPECTAVRPR